VGNGTALQRLVGAYRPTVVIPMAFSEMAYLDEVRRGLAASGRPVLHFCLTASLDVVQQRLSARGEAVDDPRFAWVHRRAIECCEAHRSPAFATLVPTDFRSAVAVKSEVSRLARVMTQ